MKCCYFKTCLQKVNLSRCLNTGMKWEPLISKHPFVLSVFPLQENSYSAKTINKLSPKNGSRCLSSFARSQKQLLLFLPEFLLIKMRNENSFGEGWTLVNFEQLHNYKKRPVSFCWKFAYFGLFVHHVVPSPFSNRTGLHSVPGTLLDAGEKKSHNNRAVQFHFDKCFLSFIFIVSKKQKYLILYIGI